MNKAPPINGTNVIYEEPPLGTLKFQDGKSIVYSCLNPGNNNDKYVVIFCNDIFTLFHVLYEKT